MPPTNGQPQPPVPGPPQRVPTPEQRVVHAPKLHPEAENLAHLYSSMLVELDQARARISSLRRELEEERRERLYWKNFVRQVAEAGMRMLQEEPQD